MAHIPQQQATEYFRHSVEVLKQSRMELKYTNENKLSFSLFYEMKKIEMQFIAFQSISIWA